MNTFNKHDIGYKPRRHPSEARACATLAAGTTLIATLLLLFVLAPIHPFGTLLGLLETWNSLDDPYAETQIEIRFILALCAAALAGLVAHRFTWRHTPLTEPFIQQSDQDPVVLYGEFGRSSLRGRLLVACPR